MRDMGFKLKKAWKSGDIVRVASPSQIIKTLDAHGAMEGLPFMPEMIDMIGKTYEVSHRALRTCVEGHGLRGMKSVVFLKDVRCDGAEHEACQRDCLIFWKDAWLEEATGTKPENKDEYIAALTALKAIKSKQDDGFYCQSTELSKASFAISRTHFGILLQEFRLGELDLMALLHVLYRAAINRMRRTFGQDELGLMRGPRGQKSRGELGLKSGDKVRIKDKPDIQATLGPNARNLGLSFEPEMGLYVGQTFEVGDVIERMVHEETGQMVRLERTVSLKNVYCQGLCAKQCPRRNPLFWREIWLERV